MGKQYTQVLAEVRGGQVQMLASQKLDELIKAVQVAGKSGKLTVELTLEPHGKENREIYVSAKVKLAAPVDPNMAEPSIFFVDRNGALVRDDPAQERIPFRGEKADGRSPAEQAVG